MTHHTSASGK